MKTVLSLLGPRQIAAMIVCAFLAALAFFLKFCVPGYSVSAWGCLCLIGLILFYALMPMVGLRLPKFAKSTTLVVTVVLCIGLTVVTVTEALIIRASFGDPQEQVGYICLLYTSPRPRD